MSKILIVDDDRVVAGMVAEIVRHMGHEAACVFSGAEGLEMVRSRNFDVVFLDVQLPDGNGLMLLPDIHAAPSTPEVIIITGFGSADGAELAVRNGAWDFVEKPLTISAIVLPLTRALQYREAKKEKSVPVMLKREGIVGSSSAMAACLNLIAQTAASDAGILIVGETGTGKELFARAVHANSPKSDKPFVVVDCASLPSALIESILFGYEKGAFTGADKAREGLIGQASGGTLFLDEVGELPLSTQKAFLRVLQERRFRPLGAGREITSDFRVLAATNRDLSQMAKSGKFRNDLLFRLRAFTIELPPLRSRAEDIRELAFHYTSRLCGRYGAEIKGFSAEFLEALCAYDWPGNVRELINALEGALASACHEPILFPKHLPTNIRVRLARDTVNKKEERAEASVNVESTLREVRNEAVWRAEKRYLEELMTATRWNIKKACEKSDLSRVRLYALLRKYDIKREPQVLVLRNRTCVAKEYNS